MKAALSLLAVPLLSPLPGPANAPTRMDRITGQPFATRSEVLARHGMAATSQLLATQAALDVLKAGGSAVDAAIAANAVLCVTEPTGCGLGGDLFLLPHQHRQRRTEQDHRPEREEAADAELVCEDQELGARHERLAGLLTQLRIGLPRPRAISKLAEQVL